MSSADSSLTSSQLLSSSPDLKKTYRSAQRLFLERQLPESLSTLELIVTRERPGDEVAVNGDSIEPAPIASASKNWRIAVWSLYLALLDVIIKLGPEDGESAFGTRRWREIASKVRDGQVWAEVVQDGYHGIERDVDADVVINLATLLLSHSSSPSDCRERLESYLATSASSHLDISEHVLSHSFEDGTSLAPKQSITHSDGTNTPRDLKLRCKVLEFYTLSILPRSEEWTYAETFIRESNILDEESRESLLGRLQVIRDDYFAQAAEEARRQHEEQLAIEKQQAAAQQAAKETAKREAESTKSEQDSPAHRRGGSEVDYGIESYPNGHASASATKASKAIRPRGAPASGTRMSPAHGTARPAKRSTAPMDIYARASGLVKGMRELILSMSRSLHTNPMILLRTLFFLIGLLLALSRQDVRDRVRRMTANGWGKLKGTVGMGVKVSYI